MRGPEGQVAREYGFSAMEMMAVVCLLGLLTASAVGIAGRVREQSSVRALVSEVEALVAHASTRAVLARTHVGLVFSQDEHGVYGRLYQDGDGDGVLREDIRSGVDRALGSPVHLRVDEAFAGLPRDVTRDPMGNPIGSDDPVRFGRGGILSFGPLGTATSGSLYLQDLHGREAWAFRVAGLGGRVRAFRWWKGRWRQVT